MSLRALGWNRFFETALAPWAQQGLIAARVAVQHRGGYEVWTADGILTADVPGRVRHLAHPRADREAAQVIEFQCLIRAADHELGLTGIQQWRISREHPDVDPPRSQSKCRSSREQRCADHALVAADDTHAAVVAFVAVVRAWLEHPGQDLAADQASLRRSQRLGIEIECAHVYLSAVIGAVQCQKTRLERDESHGMGCAYRAAHYAAGIGLQAARHIQSENGRAAVVDCRYPLCTLSGDIAFQPIADYAVDGLAQATYRRRRGEYVAAGSAPGAQCSGSVRGKFFLVSGENDGHIEPPLLQMAGKHESVAAIVAGTGEDQDGFAVASRDIACYFGGRESCSFH